MAHFYSPLNGRLLHRNITPFPPPPNIKFACTVRVTCLAQEQNAMTPARKIFLSPCNSNVLLIQENLILFLSPNNIQRFLLSFLSQIRIPKCFSCLGFVSVTYLFSIIIRSCFLYGNIGEMYVYSFKMLRTENQVLL